MRDDVVIHAVVHESTDHVWCMMFLNELVMHDLCFVNGLIYGVWYFVVHRRNNPNFKMIVLSKLFWQF